MKSMEDIAIKTNRQTNRQTDRQTERQTERQTDRQTDVHTHTQRMREMQRHTFFKFEGSLWKNLSNQSGYISSRTQETKLFKY